MSATLHRRRRKAASRAFTLLELLIALTISAVVALSLFSSLYIVFKARENSMAGLAPVSSAELAMEMIRQDVQAALPEAPPTNTSASITLPGQTPINTTGALIGAFEGQIGGGEAGGDSLLFYSTGYAPPHTGQNGQVVQSPTGEVKQVCLMMRQRNNSNVLVRQVWGNLLTQQQLDPDEEVICRYVTNFTLQYYDGVQWQTSWDSTQYNNSLPTAVQVTIDISPPNVRQPIELRRVFMLSCLTPPVSTASQTATPNGQ